MRVNMIDTEIAPSEFDATFGTGLGYRRVPTQAALLRGEFTLRVTGRKHRTDHGTQNFLPLPALANVIRHLRNGHQVVAVPSGRRRRIEFDVLARFQILDHAGIHTFERVAGFEILEIFMDRQNIGVILSTSKPQNLG